MVDRGQTKGIPTVRSRVLLVFGGDSSEHEVSCLTAGGVLRALDRDRFDVTCVGIAKGGRWVAVDEATVGDVTAAAEAAGNPRVG